MAVCIRAKRVNDPLDERVCARLRGTITDYASSGSEHDAAATVSHSCFSNLIHGFFEHEDARDELDKCEAGEDSDSDDGAAMQRAVELEKKLVELLHPDARVDPFMLRLRLEVETALRPTGTGSRRAVMKRLREKGYNAGICKARWESARGLTAGSYEYIDVINCVGTEEDRRYIIDLGFSAEFEVARPTEEYERMVSSLPATAVVRPELMQAIVRIVAEAAQLSLKTRGLSVPPWRKKRYLLAKWQGPYRRTVNFIPATVGATMDAGRGSYSEVKSRTVGFGAPVVGGLSVPAAAELGKGYFGL